ncbi:hypothetical protein [Bradyrhizobium sp. CCGB20]|uniref:hypothetical protein n=1 Tax=Bradyrhizobium sp. CCGB20 TaxID=2949633 RepID=UPI0035C774AF
MVSMSRVFAINVRRNGMEGIRTIIDHFPQRELDIRRRFARDASFRAICADYEEAAKAQHHWQQAANQGDPTAARNVEDYTNLLIELEREILSHLNRS